jgi:hypothetical protein
MVRRHFSGSAEKGFQPGAGIPFVIVSFIEAQSMFNDNASIRDSLTDAHGCGDAPDGAVANLDLLMYNIITICKYV